MSTTKFSHGHAFDSWFQFPIYIGLRHNLKYIIKTVVFVQMILDRGNGQESRQTSKKQTNRLRVLLEGL